jgi:hypothetical protein
MTIMMKVPTVKMIAAAKARRQGFKAKQTEMHRDDRSVYLHALAGHLLAGNTASALELLTYLARLYEAPVIRRLYKAAQTHAKLAKATLGTAG